MNHVKDIDGTFDQKMKLILEYIISYDRVLKNTITPVQDTYIHRDYYLLYLESIRGNKEAKSVLKKFNKDLFEFNVELIESTKKSGEITAKAKTEDLSYINNVYL